MPAKAISTDKAPAALGPYSQGIDTGSLIFTSGQVPIDPAVGKITVEDISEQARQCMENIKNILAAAGLGMENVIKTTIFLTDFADFQAVNKVYASYFTGVLPARSTMGNATLVPGAKVEIEAIALR